MIYCTLGGQGDETGGRTGMEDAKGGGQEAKVLYTGTAGGAGRRGAATPVRRPKDKGALGLRLIRV